MSPHSQKETTLQRILGDYTVIIVAVEVEKGASNPVAVEMDIDKLCLQCEVVDPRALFSCRAP